MRLPRDPANHHPLLVHRDTTCCHPFTCFVRETTLLLFFFFFFFSSTSWMMNIGHKGFAVLAPAVMLIVYDCLPKAWVLNQIIPNYTTWSFYLISCLMILVPNYLPLVLS
jgi:hypothetical protein